MCEMWAKLTETHASMYAISTTLCDCHSVTIIIWANANPNTDWGCCVRQCWVLWLLALQKQLTSSHRREQSGGKPNASFVSLSFLEAGLLCTCQTNHKGKPAAKVSFSNCPPFPCCWPWFLKAVKKKKKFHFVLHEMVTEALSILSGIHLTGSAQKCREMQATLPWETSTAQ